MRAGLKPAPTIGQYLGTARRALWCQTDHIHQGRRMIGAALPYIIQLYAGFS
jgi:hypothetical protein